MTPEEQYLAQLPDDSDYWRGKARERSVSVRRLSEALAEAPSEFHVAKLRERLALWRSLALIGWGTVLCCLTIAVLR